MEFHAQCHCPLVDYYPLFSFSALVEHANDIKSFFRQLSSMHLAMALLIDRDHEEKQNSTGPYSIFTAIT